MNFTLSQHQKLSKTPCRELPSLDMLNKQYIQSHFCFISATQLHFCFISAYTRMPCMGTITLSVWYPYINLHYDLLHLSMYTALHLLLLPTSLMQALLRKTCCKDLSPSMRNKQTGASSHISLYFLCITRSSSLHLRLLFGLIFTILLSCCRLLRFQHSSLHC